jgi:hypothetical protein
MPHDLLHDVEAVKGCGKVDCWDIFREFGPRGRDLLDLLPLQGLAILGAPDATASCHSGGGAAKRRPVRRSTGRDRARRAGRRTRIAAAARVEGKDRRRSGGASLWRGRHWRVAAHCRVAGTISRGAAHAPALFLLAAAYRQRVLSDHQPDGVCRRIGARRQTAIKDRQVRTHRSASSSCSYARRVLLGIRPSDRYFKPEQRRSTVSDLGLERHAPLGPR